MKANLTKGIALTLSTVMMLSVGTPLRNVKAEEQAVMIEGQGTAIVVDEQEGNIFEINNQYVDEIENYSINIPNNMKFNVRDYNNSEQMLTLTLNEPCSVMISVNNVDVKYERERSDGQVDAKVSGLEFEMFSDPNKINKIKNIGSVGRQSVQTYVGPYYLDAGVYYISVIGVDQDDEGTTTGQYCIGAVIERSSSNEEFTPSSFNMPNTVKIGDEFYGFASEVYKTDYYTFTVDKESLVTVGINKQSGEGKIIIEILDRDKVVCETKNVSGIVDTSVSKYLSPGQYYIRVTNDAGTNNDTVGKGGRIKFKLTNLVYNITYTLDKTKKTNQSVIVSVDTNFSTYGCKAVAKNKMKTSDLKNTWNIATIYGNDDELKIDKNGSYYILVKDKEDNIVYKLLTVSNIDTKAPARPVIKEYKKDKTKIAGTAESKSKVTVCVKYKTKAGLEKVKKYIVTTNSKGKWTVKKSIKLKKGYVITATAKDEAGNIGLERKVTVKK